jgi:L-iditol 2-dehydrogenase
MEIGETPQPEIRDPHDVLLRIGAVGVCGSDVHYYTDGRIGDLVVKYPEMTGHECGATVVAVGDQVKRVKVGQRAAVDPLITCGHCDQCLSGRENTCRHQAFLACPGQAPGALAEYLVMPEQSCFPIPESMTMVQAALVEPLAIGLYAQRMAQMQAGAKIAILGSGPIGLSVLLASRAACDCKVYATDLLDERLEVARRCGANWAGNPKQIDVARAILEAEPQGVDFAFECAGEQETVDQGIALLKPGGTLLMIGIPAVDRVSLDIHPMRRKEIQFRLVRRQNHCTAPAIELVAKGAINVDQLATHHFSLAEAKKAFDLAADYRDGVVKAMVHVAE